jgi:hypothetical protein
MKHKVQRETYLTVYAEVFPNKCSDAMVSEVLEIKVR